MVVMSHDVPSLDTDDLRDVLFRSGNSYVELHARSGADGRFAPILLQKSKIECPRKSRESRFLGISIGARILGADAKVRGRFYVKRYGPSRREARDASAPLRISVHHPKNTFATKSAKRRHGIASINERGRQLRRPYFRAL